jgi:hypothetical protein
MSNVNKIAKKTVKISENDLVDLIDNIVNEAVATKKTQWIAEQSKKETKTTTVLENKIAALEAKFQTLLEGKK